MAHDIFDDIVAGVVPPPPSHVITRADTLTRDELEVSYKLSRHVPDMARGFAIHTNYGEFQVEGPLALLIQALVRDALANELAMLGRLIK